MEYGLIKDTTIQGIADGFRAKGIVPETRKETIYVDSTFLHSGNISSLEEPYYTTSPTYSSNYTITVPGAASLELRIKLGIKESGDSPCDEFRVLDKNNTGVWSTVISRPMPRKDVIKEYTINVEGDTAILDPYNWSGYTMNYGVSAEVFAKDAEGNYITGIFSKEIDVTNTITPEEMVEALTNAPAVPPEEVFHLTGNLNYMFCDSHWGWYLEAYKDKFTTSNITNMMNTFKARGIELGDILDLPFTFNVNNITNMASAFDSQNLLTKSPKIRGTIDWSSANKADLRCIGSCYGLADLEDLFTSEMLEGFKTVKVTSSYSTPKPVQFYMCRSLRRIPSWFYKFQLNKDSTAFPAGTYQIYSNLFSQCLVLDEAHNIPVWVCVAPATSNLFSGTFDTCLRLKDYTFETVDGQPIVANWKNQTINIYDQVGYANGGYYYVDLVSKHNSGITVDKKVTDDASYQALKNDPDWFTDNVAYSRYDHDSAVRTINSLPDTSAYLATAGGTNTIKFKGIAGEKTDGGAINTLTPEEIAVATAKGWTVTLV